MCHCLCNITLSSNAWAFVCVGCCSRYSAFLGSWKVTVRTSGHKYPNVNFFKGGTLLLEVQTVNLGNLDRKIWGAATTKLASMVEAPGCSGGSWDPGSAITSQGWSIYCNGQNRKTAECLMY